MSEPHIEQPQKKKKWPWIVGILAVLVIIGVLVGGGDEETTTAGDTTTTTTTAPETTEPATAEETTVEETTTTETTTEAQVQPYGGPWLTPLPVPMAEEQSGLRLNAVDIGQHIVDDVNQERGIFDRANWRVVAFCETTDGDTLNVGVIKSEESAAISQAQMGAGIAENSYAFILDCP